MSTNARILFPDLFGSAPHIVREFLYAALGLRDLQDLYDVARSRHAPCLAQAVLDDLQIDVKVTKEDLGRIPKAGSVMVVANHPYGFLDGLILDAILMRVRPDICLMLNTVLSHLEEFRTRCIPIDVYNGQRATFRNATKLRRAVESLREHKGVACFPSGEVSHWEYNRFETIDREWSCAPVRCAALADASIVPVFFAGSNSLSFQLAGLVHPHLRTARLPGELLNKRGRTISVRIGNPIRAREFKRFASFRTATDYVRARTYLLGKRELQNDKSAPRLDLMRARRMQPVGNKCPGFKEEMKLLEQRAVPIVESASYSVFVARGANIPAIIDEIGRLRELTFRAAGEGTGRSKDIDDFDSAYTHLILWHKDTQSIAGSYRLAWTKQILSEKGPSGLYTSTLFHYQPEFFCKLGPAVEVGRSFVTRQFQKDYSALLLLWQAIAGCVATRADSPVLFGAVSISTEYSDVSRQLITEFVSTHSYDHELAELATPRHAFRARSLVPECKVISRCIREMDDLVGSIADLGNSSGVPVLLRHYLNLGGRLVGFSVDRKFSDSLDGLLVVDLRRTSPKLLARYMGKETAERFRKQAGIGIGFECMPATEDQWIAPSPSESVDRRIAALNEMLSQR